MVGKTTGSKRVASPPRNWQWIFFPKAQLRHLVLLPPMTSLSPHEAHGRKFPGSAFSPPWGWGSGWGCWVSYGGVRGLEFRGCQFFETQLMHLFKPTQFFLGVCQLMNENLHTNIDTRSWKKKSGLFLGRPNKNLSKSSWLWLACRFVWDIPAISARCRVFTQNSIPRPQGVFHVFTVHGRSISTSDLS